MSKALLLQQLNELFRDVLNNDSIVLENHTTAKDIEEWDSLNHIQLVVAIEKKFSVRFKSLEIQSWKNVGSIIDSIADKNNTPL